MTRRALLMLLAVAVVIAGAGAAWWRLQSAATTPGVTTAERRVTIPAGASLRSALRVLEAEGLVRDPRLFEIYLRCCRAGARGTPAVKAGQYLIAPGSTPLQILNQLVEGRVILEQLTLVEGWTFTQVRAALGAHPSVGQSLRGRSDAQVMQALGHPGLFPEGRFAPDTYRFAAGTPDAEILRMAFAAQQKALQEAWDSRAPDLPLATADEALTLASIVEKETGLASERPRIAGVFVNRLRRGMRLQSDPTVIYGIREHYDGNIRRSDLVTDTPYNTYTRAGLPPTPIAMPGREALRAATHPEPGDALYFVAVGDGSGAHVFTATYEEHNRAVRRFLERQRAGGASPR